MEEGSLFGCSSCLNVARTGRPPFNNSALDRVDKGRAKLWINRCAEYPAFHTTISSL